jgi:inosine/xanthosine triphosphatase
MASSPRTITVAVGSTNRAKIAATKSAFEQAFSSTSSAAVVVDVQGFDVASGVPDQPVGDDDTKRGATHRAQRAYEAARASGGLSPTFSVGLEGGISTVAEGADIECFAYMVVYDGSRFGTSRTATFMLPEAVAALVRGGIELGDADASVFNRMNAKQGEGTVGHLTRGAMDRSAYYSHAIVLALIPFQWPELYTRVE